MSRLSLAQAEQHLDEYLEGNDQWDQAVPLTSLIESGHNARHKFDPGKLEELAASIRQKGVLEPLIVRPFVITEAGESRPAFEIVAGARRFRASKLANRTHVPCVIRAYSDSDVLELQIIENVQREDLDPLEEAAGYTALIQSNPSRYSAGFIADRIGRSEKYVWDRLRLLTLVPEAKALLDAGRITVGHATQVSKLTAAQQLKLVHPDGGLWRGEINRLSFADDSDHADAYHGLEPVSVRELEAYIAAHVRFDAKQAAIVAPLEFGPVAQRIDEALAKPGRGRKLISITHEATVAADARDDSDRTYTARTWKRADGQEDSRCCEHAVLGVVAVGPGYGEAFDVCIAKDTCDVHWRAERREKQQTQKLRDTGQVDEARRREEERQKAAAEEQQRLADKKTRWQAARPSLIEALGPALKRAKPSQLAELIYNACDRASNKPYLKAARVRIRAKHRADDIVRQAAFIVLANELFGYQGDVTFPRLAKPLGIDVAKVLKSQAKRGTAKESK